MIKKIIFIGGNVHSGNTFLCNVLRNVPNSFVFDGEARFYEKKKIKFKNKKELKKLIYFEFDKLNGFYKKKIKLDLSKIDINKFKINFGEEFLKLLIKAINKKKNNFYIQKATSVIMFQNEIFRYSNKSKIIFLLRNPLSIFSSIKKRQLNLKKKISILRFLTKYYFVLKKVNKNNKNIKIIKYENLISNFRKELKQVEKFIGIKLNKINYLPIVNTSSNIYKKNKSTGLLKKKINPDISILNENEIFLINIFEKTFGNNYKNNLILPKINLILFLSFLIRELIKLLIYPPADIYKKIFS